jgi:hypothetical protein
VSEGDGDSADGVGVSEGDGGSADGEGVSEGDGVTADGEEVYEGIHVKHVDYSSTGRGLLEVTFVNDTMGTLN